MSTPPVISSNLSVDQPSNTIEPDGPIAQNQPTAYIDQVSDAMRAGDVVKVKALLAQPGASLSGRNKENQTLLHTALNSGHYAMLMLEALVNSGLPLNFEADNREAQTESSEKTSIGSLFAQAGANINAAGKEIISTVKEDVIPSVKETLSKVSDQAADLEEKVRNDVGPTIDQTLRNDVGPAIDQTLRNDVGPAIDQAVRKTFRW